MADQAIEHYKNGLKLYGERKFVESQAEYKLGLDLRPGWTECLQALGMAQMNAGQLPEALETLLQVTKEAPDDPLAFTSLSMIYVRMENIDAAETAQAKARMLSWKQELKENPNTPPPDNGGMHVTQ